MALSVTEDTKLGLQALAYVIELYRELLTRGSKR
jgi:hypothetical protein